MHFESLPCMDFHNVSFEDRKFITCTGFTAALQSNLKATHYILGSPILTKSHPPPPRCCCASRACTTFCGGGSQCHLTQIQGEHGTGNRGKNGSISAQVTTTNFLPVPLTGPPPPLPDIPPFPCPIPPIWHPTAGLLRLSGAVSSGGETVALLLLAAALYHGDH